MRKNERGSVCVCERLRERERMKERRIVCVRERERMRESLCVREKERMGETASVCVCV